MFKNHFKIAWRNLQRNKAYAIINVTGLSLGIACGIIIFTVVTYHASFDGFHANKNRIYRIVTDLHEDNITYSPGVPQPMGKAFRNDYAMAEKTAMVAAYKNALIALPNDKQQKKFLEEPGIAFAEPAFFDIFNFPLVQGDEKTALAEPNSAIITQHLANKYFTGDAIGKIIRFNNKVDFKITGILQDIPVNTDRQTEIYVSYQNFKDYKPGLANDSSWGSINSGVQCFLLLKPNITQAQVDAVFPALSKKYFNAEDAKVNQFHLQPLADIHFNPDYGGYINKRYLWALFFIGLFLIITACVNFVNLATAQALNRSKEVGIRKVMGSLPRQLFWQFITETALIAVFAVVVACALAVLAIPWLNQLFNTKMVLDFYGALPLFLLGLMVLVVFLSGSYPGLVMAKFRPILALKSKLSQKDAGGFSLRRLLVVTQFAISQMLIIGTIVIATQVNYSKTADLGFSKDAVLIVPVPVTDRAKVSTMRAQLAGVSGIKRASFCFQPAATGSNNTTSMRYDNRPKDEPWEINMKVADDQYLETFGMKLVAGRNFYPSDTPREALVNEAVLAKLNIRNPQDIIGKKISLDDGQFIPVVGVVKNFYNNSFHEEVSAICITPSYKRYQFCAIKISPASIRPVLGQVEKIWSATFPDYLYSYKFQDEQIAKFYELDDVMLSLIEIFAVIAVFIGCLGLYGLVSFMAVRKTKEIGVRKVLGAGMPQILWLFGREFTQLLAVAFLIAAPVAGWVMTLYLQDFKNRITIGPGIFALAVIITMLVACLTVGYRSLKAALANPVKSLRTE